MPSTRTPRNSKGRFVKRAHARRRRRANATGVVFSGKAKWGSKYKGRMVPVYRPRIKLVSRRRGKRARPYIGKIRARSVRASMAQRARVSALRTPGRAYYNNPPRRRRRRKSRRARAVVAMNPPRRRRRRKARRAARFANPVRRRRRRRARVARFANPFRRRRSRRSRRHRNPSGKRRRFARRRRSRNPFGIALPSLGGFNLNTVVDTGIDAGLVGAGAWLASWIPQQLVGFVPSYAWLNQGYYGVALSGFSTGVAAWGAKKFVSPRVAKLVMIGGGLTTLFRLLTQVAPAQAIQAVPADIKSQIFFLGAASAGAKGVTGYGDSGYFSASDIVRGERKGVADWVQAGGRSLAMNDWVDMGGSAAPLRSSNENF